MTAMDFVMAGEAAASGGAEGQGDEQCGGFRRRYVLERGTQHARQRARESGEGVYLLDISDPDSGHEHAPTSRAVPDFVLCFASNLHRALGRWEDRQPNALLRLARPDGTVDDIRDPGEREARLAAFCTAGSPEPRLLTPARQMCPCCGREHWEYGDDVAVPDCPDCGLVLSAPPELLLPAGCDTEGIPITHSTIRGHLARWEDPDAWHGWHCRSDDAESWALLDEARDRARAWALERGDTYLLTLDFSRDAVRGHPNGLVYFYVVSAAALRELIEDFDNSCFSVSEVARADGSLLEVEDPGTREGRLRAFCDAA